jgi:hypothetical protein
MEPKVPKLKVPSALKTKKFWTHLIAAASGALASAASASDFVKELARQLLGLGAAQ